MNKPTVDVLIQLQATRTELCAALKRDDITYEQIDRLPPVRRLDAIIVGITELFEAIQPAITEEGMDQAELDRLREVFTHVGGAHP